MKGGMIARVGTLALVCGSLPSVESRDKAPKGQQTLTNAIRMKLVLIPAANS